MFGFSLRGLAEAAINTITGAPQNDEEISKLVKEAESQNSAFVYQPFIADHPRNVIAITKELEKQVITLGETNSSILRHMEELEDREGKRGVSVDVWRRASRFYYSVGSVKDQLYPTIVNELIEY